ncbi:LON-domain-containing protein [Thelephora terrestris]|uniref:LON-domain-containing protein n=1 Tax=Thelephora terrestris TaxID=56493 RepID=A0A9P6HCD3_9AGAM|nr:LON-domain-containing protein [Thelephora terrestris]
MPLRRLLPLLSCPLCALRRGSSPLPLLRSPFTLHCGHTVCSSHLESLDPTQRCPLPTCTSTPNLNTARPNIPSSSRVIYLSAASPAPSSQQPSTTSIEQRIDVTVSKLIEVVSRHSPPPPPSSDLEDFDHSDEDNRYARFPNASSDEDAEFRVGRGTSRSSGHRRRRAPEPTSRFTPNRPDPESPRTWDDSRTTGDVNKELLTELSCEICFAIYYQPVTTPCQHTFCVKCLQRSLDHRSHCPVCRADLPDYVYLYDIPRNKVVLAIESEAFPELCAERKERIEEEERNARLNTPLFVCQLSFPGVPTNLHFYEPRYRLMLRRCLESPTQRFGMIMPPKSASGATMDFGTMLEIRAVKMLPDGRSLVHTRGVSRFRILERGTLDGYMVGRIEYIEDYPEELEDTLDLALEEKAALEAENPKAPAISRVQSPPRTPPPADAQNAPRVFSPRTERRLLATSNEALMNKCRTFVEQLRDGAAPWIVQKLNDSYGNMPTDATNFSFWVALVLPIDEYEKAKLLPIRSARLRLKLVAHWIDQLNSNW